MQSSPLMVGVKLWESMIGAFPSVSGMAKVHDCGHIVNSRNARRGDDFQAPINAMSLWQRRSKIAAHKAQILFVPKANIELAQIGGIHFDILSFDSSTQSSG